MRLRGLKLFGHPVHPMLVGFPLASWLATTLWDGVSLLRQEPYWPQLAFWSLALGLAAALPTAASGLWDLAALGERHPATITAWWHGGTMSVAFCCELASLLLRRDSLAVGPAPASALALAAAGSILAVAGGWLGGELVFRHGLAVEERTREDEAETR